MSDFTKSASKDVQTRDGPISRHWEQVLAVGSSLITILGPPASYLAGASLNVVIAIALLCFFALTVLSILFANRSPGLTRVLTAAAGVLIFGVVGIHTYQDARPTVGKQVVPEAINNLAPPRLEIRAWLDKPTLERGIDGRPVYLDSNGKRDLYEDFISPIEVRASNRANSTLLRNIPGQFNEFDPGDTIVARVCGIEYVKDTYKRDDKRFADQMVWEIPVKISEERNCKK